MNNEVPGVVVSNDIINRLRKASSKEDGMKIGVDIVMEIVDASAPYIQGFQISAPFVRIKIGIDVVKSNKKKKEK